MSVLELINALVTENLAFMFQHLVVGLYPKTVQNSNFPTLIMKEHQQHTFRTHPFWVLRVSTNELMSCTWSVWLGRVWKSCLKLPHFTSPHLFSFTVPYFSPLKVHLNEWIKTLEQNRSSKSKAVPSHLPAAYIEAVSFQISNLFFSIVWKKLLQFMPRKK